MYCTVPYLLATVPERLRVSAGWVTQSILRSWQGFLIQRTAFELILQTLTALDVATPASIQLQRHVFFVDKPDITEQTVAILCRCQDLYWRRGTSAVIPSSETSSSSTSQRLSYITQEPEVHNRVYKSPYGPQFPLTCPFLVHGPFQRALPRPGRYVTSPNMLVCKMRSCWSCAQPPSWRTTPYRLIAVSTQLPVCSCDAQTSVQTRQLPAIEILHKRS